MKKGGLHVILVRSVGRSRAWLTELSLSESASLGYVGLQAYALLYSILHVPPPTAAVLSRGLVTHKGRGQQ